MVANLKVDAAVTAIPVVLLCLPPGSLLDLPAAFTSAIEYHLEATVRLTGDVTDVADTCEVTAPVALPFQGLQLE